MSLEGEKEEKRRKPLETDDGESRPVLRDIRSFASLLLSGIICC